MKLTKKALLLLYSPSKCSFTLSKLICNAWFFLLAARHRMQALFALACCVGCAFSGFASLKTALFIQLLTNEGAPLTFGSPSFVYTILVIILSELYLKEVFAVVEFVAYAEIVEIGY